MSNFGSNEREHQQVPAVPSPTRPNRRTHHPVRGRYAHGVHAPKATAAIVATRAPTTGALPQGAGATARGPAWCTLPPPGPKQSSPPAGQGLTKGNEFGPSAIRTAGGYTIVPEGKDQAWSIYAPGQKPGEKPHTRIWGDPHVDEKDGTRWDFTNNSNFRLPDGTNIAVKTVKLDGFGEGYKVSESLDITNGFDRISVTGLSEDKPRVGEVTGDGYSARANLAVDEAFVLGGDKDKVSWFKTEKGIVQGEITGAKMEGNAYQQTLDKGVSYAVDPSLQPKVGSEAWGIMLRDQAIDVARDVFGKGSFVAEVTAFGAAIDHAEDRIERQLAPVLEAFNTAFFSWLSRSVSLFDLLGVKPNRPAFSAF